MVPAEADLAEGALLGKYRLVRLVGKGGMGTVWEAEPADPEQPRRRVAIKVLPKAVAADSVVRARFEREGEIAARLHHPHIVDVTDVGTFDDIPFLVMEFLEGEDLGTLLDRTRPLPEAQIADFMLPICAAVGAAHREGIIHRDIKPENVFLSTKHEPDGTTTIVPKLLDFGISKVAAALAGSNDLTKTSSMLGTPYYMSPEQVRGAKYIDPRSDVYALGVILYECATGRRPFEDASLYNLLLNIVSGTVPPPRGENPSLSEEFEAVVLQAMAREVDARTANVFLLGKNLLPFASPAVREAWEPVFESPPTEPIEVSQKSEELASNSRRSATQRRATPAPDAFSSPSPAAGVPVSGASRPLTTPPPTMPSGGDPNARPAETSTSPATLRSAATEPARTNRAAFAWIAVVSALALVVGIAVVRSTRDGAAANVAASPRKGTLSIVQAPPGAVVLVDGAMRACPDGKLALEGPIETVFDVTVRGPNGAVLASQKVRMTEAGLEPPTLAVPAQ